MADANCVRAVDDTEKPPSSKKSASSSVLLAEKIRKLPVEKSINRKITDILKPLLEASATNFDETCDLQGVEQFNNSIYTIVNSFDAKQDAIRTENQGHRRSHASQEATDRPKAHAVE